MLTEGFESCLKMKHLLLETADFYKNSQPFPHLVLDKVFTRFHLFRLLSVFPRPDESWWKYDNALERKFAKDDLSGENLLIQDTVAYLQSRQFTDFLTAVTGIPNLIVDQTLRGGGLHQIARGGKLDIHADFNIHPETKLDRRLNVLLYLNPDWKEEWKGCLELWDRDMKTCVKKILPEMGRMVIFSTTSWAYHGHPDPLECPEGVTRKSIALYYYTNGRPEEERTETHSTLYQARPQDSKDPETEALRKHRAKGRLPH